MDYIGQKYGRLTVLETYKDSKGTIRCKCICECGNHHEASLVNLQFGSVKSCGCLAHEWSKSGNARRKHNGNGTRLYRIWKSMRERCNTKTASNYHRYGGRGIHIYNEWNEFSAFKKWALDNGYRDDLTLDRIDVNDIYCPDNCRWVTMKEQNNNRRNNIRYSFDGKELTLSEWSDIVKIPMKTLWARIKTRGWSVEKALTTPVMTFQQAR